MENEEEFNEYMYNSESGFLPSYNDTTFQKAVECLKVEFEPESQVRDLGLYCPQIWDTLLCWPRTPAGTLALLPCFEEFHGIKYDTSQNASRLCHSNGTWDNYTDYTACKNMPLVEETGRELSIVTSSTLYLIGYSMSLIALSIAVWIFLYFKDLRCLRNTIHTNLMFTYILAAFFWILAVTLQSSIHESIGSCVVMVIILHYFNLTNFFWMFVEGLYLYMLVVETFTGENIKLRVYVVIGWGVPVIIIIVWAIAKTFAPPETDHQSTSAEYEMMKGCAFWGKHTTDWIYKVSALGVLAINCVFLVMIMWVLITKLRATNNAETQQYRKATKALVVLIPLLGVTYILMILGPSDGFTAEVYEYVRSVLISTQGFTIALFYCFLNTEVQNTVRHHLERWKTARSLGGSRRYTYSSKDWSPRSRTESIRLSLRTSNASGIGVPAAATTITTPTFGPTLTVENAV